MDTRFVVRGTLAAAFAGLLVAGCAEAIDGHPITDGSSGGTSAAGQSSPGQPSSGSSSPGGAPSYQPPPDNSGYSTKLFDQPQPLPSHLSRLGCSWLAGFRRHLASLHPTGTGPTGSGCQILFGGGEVAQIRAFGPYTRVVDATSYLKPVSVRGMEGRLYSFVPQTTDKICSVVFNPRALTGVTVDGFNSKPTNGDFQAHCRLAMKVADIVAKTYVPDGGGHPFAGTPQQPSAATLKGATACQVVNKGSIIFANDVADDDPKEGRTSAGSTCDYTSDHGYGSIRVLLTPPVVGGLDGIIPKAGTHPVRTYLGLMRARRQQREDGCTYSVEFRTGQVVELDYTLGSALTDESYRQTTCFAARAAMSGSLMDLMSSQ